MKNTIAVFVFNIIPKSLVSRLFGYIARLELPHFFLNLIITWYSRKFKVKTEYITPPGGFKNFDDFFTRRLRDGIHATSWNKKIAVSPVDARIDQYGDILESTIVQAKGLTYTLPDLIPADTSKKFKNGKFITLYLSPGDYHRIHSPVSGTITGYFNIPGKLFTVQDYMVKGLEGLFVKNERIITYIQSDSGIVAICKIGALNVGRISLSYCDLITNKLFRRRQEFFFHENDRVPVKACEEIGVFHMGSTVILLFQKNTITFKNFKPGDKIRMGDSIGTLHYFNKKRMKSS